MEKPQVIFCPGGLFVMDILCLVYFVFIYCSGAKTTFSTDHFTFLLNRGYLFPVSLSFLRYLLFWFDRAD